MPESLSNMVPGPRAELVNTTLLLDADTVEWLDEIGDTTNRSRSDVAREIFRNVRSAEKRRTDPEEIA